MRGGLLVNLSIEEVHEALSMKGEPFRLFDERNIFSIRAGLSHTLLQEDRKADQYRFYQSRLEPLYPMTIHLSSLKDRNSKLPRHT